MTNPSDAQAAVLRLAPALDIKAAVPLAVALIALRGADLVLDGSQTTRIGGQCLQVLLSAQAAWEADGHAFSLADPSADLTDGLALLGAADLFAPTAA